MQPQKKFDTFIFDLDGTLLDTVLDLVILTNQALEDCGFPPRTAEEILSFVGNGARALMYQAVPQGASEEQVDEAMQRFKDLYPEYGAVLTIPYAGIPQLLQALKEQGKRLGVLSNKFDAGTQELIAHFFPGVFDVVHGECDAIPRKPDPTGLMITMRELDAENCAYVGDSGGDMRVARAAGAFPVGVTWGYRPAEELEEAGAEFLATTPLDILELA